MSPKKAVAKPKAAPSHPPYASMVKSAIVELKERDGSSIPAISKFILSHYKIDTVNKTALSAALKKGLADGALTKVKASYKLPSTGKPKSPKPKAAKVAKSKTTIKKAAAKSKKAGKDKTKASSKSPKPKKTITKSKKGRK